MLFELKRTVSPKRTINRLLRSHQKTVIRWKQSVDYLTPELEAVELIKWLLRDRKAFSYDEGRKLWEADRRAWQEERFGYRFLIFVLWVLVVVLAGKIVLY